MAILFMDGLDMYSNVTDLGAGGWGVASFNFSTTGGRFGGGAIVNGTATTTAVTVDITGAALGDTYIACFAYRQIQSLNNVVQFRAGTVILAQLNISNAGVVTFVPQSGSNIASASGVVPSGVWVYIEFKVTFGTNASTGSVDVRVNGTSVLSGSGLDTHNGNVVTNMRFVGGGSSNSNFWDDVVLIKGAGASPTDFIGDCRIDYIIPDGDKTLQDWTKSSGSNAYELIDDTLNAHDGDSTYIFSTTAGDESEFEMSDVAGASDLVHAIQLRGRVRKTDAGAASYRLYIDSNSNRENGPTVNPTTTYDPSRNGIIPLNPDGSVAWDDTAVNALIVGAERIT